MKLVGLAVAAWLLCGAAPALAQRVVNVPSPPPVQQLNGLWIDYIKAYPKKALEDRLSGTATLACTVRGEKVRQPKDCAVISESPAGAGFGAAALKRADLLVMTSEVGAQLQLVFKFDPPPANSYELLRRIEPHVIDAAFPQAALDQKVSGKVVLGCTASSIGVPTDCKVVSESPEGVGFGAAALGLVGQARVKPYAGSTVNFPVSFPLRPYKWSMGAVTETWKLMPKQALEKNISGRAVVRCNVASNNDLEKCQVVSEDPPEIGFGEAALKGIRMLNFVVRPGYSPGPDMQVTVPFRFMASAAPLAGAAPWVKTPALSDLRAAFPAKSKEPFETVVFSCTFNALGTFETCGELSGARGYLVEAARPLTKMFSVSPELGKQYAGTRIAVALRLINPSAEQAPLTITDPVWTQLPQSVRACADNMDGCGDSANGFVDVECRVAAGGALEGCTASAKQGADDALVARALGAIRNARLSIWATDGLPSEGARVKAGMMLAESPGQ